MLAKISKQKIFWSKKEIVDRARREKMFVYLDLFQKLNNVDSDKILRAKKMEPSILFKCSSRRKTHTFVD